MEPDPEITQMLERSNRNLKITVINMLKNIVGKWTTCLNRWTNST